MKTFQLITLFALIATSMAFAPNQSPQCKSLLANESVRNEKEKPCCSCHTKIGNVYDCINNRHRFLPILFSDYLVL
jgi:hypothetical protein